MKQNLSIDKARTFKGLSGVYKITNLKTGEFYIGNSKNLNKRLIKKILNLKKNVVYLY